MSTRIWFARRARWGYAWVIEPGMITNLLAFSPSGYRSFSGDQPKYKCHAGLDRSDSDS